MTMRCEVNRLKLAWHVLRGRPLIYRATFNDAVLPILANVPENNGIIVTGCTFWGRRSTLEEQARFHQIALDVLRQRGEVGKEHDEP